MDKKLTRSKQRMICGVCGGIGEYFNIDPTLVRIIYALLLCFSAIVPLLLAYFIMAAIIPENEP